MQNRLKTGIASLVLLSFVGVGCANSAKLSSTQPQEDVMAKLLGVINKGDAQAVSEQLKHGFDPARWNDLNGKLKDSPLHIAASAGSVEILRLLLDGGLKVDLKDSHGQTPLLAASAQGRTDAARLLIERGADIKAKGGQPPNQFEPVTIAASGGHTETMKLLLDQGGNLEGDSPIATPLYFAAAGGHEQTVRFLLQRGAKVGGSVVINAIEEQHKDIARLLRAQYCNHELPKPIGIPAADRPLMNVRRLEGCSK